MEEDDYLMYKDMSPFLKVKEGRYIDEVLYISVLRGDWIDTKYLLSKGADPNFYYHDRNTPLHIAVENNDENLVDILLNQKKTLPDIQNLYGKTPLMISIERRKNRLSIRLMMENANVNIQDNLGRSPLHCASRFNNLAMMNFLIKCGAEIHQTDEFGEDALHYALRMGNIPGAILLLKFNANPNSKNKIGLPILSELALMKYSKRKFISVKLLLRYGADVNYSETFGFNPPLYYAILNNDLEIVKLFISYGADPRSKNIVGITPLEFAKRLKMTEIAKYFHQKYKH